MNHVAIFAKMQRTALVSVLVLGAATAGAQALLRFDNQTRANRETFDRLFAQTVQCLQTATLAILRQGVRDPVAVQQFNLGFCGRPMHEHLTLRMGWDPKDSQALLRRLSDLVVNDTTN